MVAVALLRKCSLCASFLRQTVRRSPGHHRRIGNDSQSTAPSRFSRTRPTSRRRIPSTELVWLWSMWWSRHNRFVVVHRIPPAQELDLVLVAGTNNSGRSDPRVLGFRRVPEPSESSRGHQHQTSLRTDSGQSTDCRSWSWWLVARAADSGE